MNPESLIFVPFLAHKLEALFDYALKYPRLALPINKSQLGKQLTESLGTKKDWDKAFNKVASRTIYVAEQGSGPGQGVGANLKGPRLSLEEHQAILTVFGFEWPHLTYWDKSERRDRNLARFKRSLVRAEYKVSLVPLRRNFEYARDALFTMEVEDESDDASFTGAIIVNPLDHRISGKLPKDDPKNTDRIGKKLRGKIVGTMGFPNFHLHVEGDDKTQLKARSEGRRLDVDRQQIEVLLRRKHGSPSWFVRPCLDSEHIVSGRFEAAQFRVTEISDGGIVNVVATCDQVHFSISKNLALDEAEESEVLHRYQKIADAKLKETFDPFDDDGKRLTLARVSLQESDSE